MQNNEKNSMTKKKQLTWFDGRKKNWDGSTEKKWKKPTERNGTEPKTDVSAQHDKVLEFWKNSWKTTPNKKPILNGMNHDWILIDHPKAQYCIELVWLFFSSFVRRSVTIVHVQFAYIYSKWRFSNFESCTYIRFQAVYFYLYLYICLFLRLNFHYLLFFCAHFLFISHIFAIDFIYKKQLFFFFFFVCLL